MTTKPIIFISYAHKDEPEKPGEGQVKWLSFVMEFLQPAVKHGQFDFWVDRHMQGGADWNAEIEAKLRACDVFILLVSRHSMASNYIVDKEIAILRERQCNNEDVYFYPLLLTPTPNAGLAIVSDKNLRPRDAKPFSGFSHHDRMQHMSDAADEIATIANTVAPRKAARASARKALAMPAAVVPAACPDYVDLTGLPETAYERLVGREEVLKRLDEAWGSPAINILSLVAEGGAGKSALVNEWLTRMQKDNYRGATSVLGWSFYSQGTKERATSAEGFLTWALETLEVTLAATASAAAKGEAVAEALMRRRVLLVLDGVEPLQHGPDGQLGQLKDQGLRALLRRFAATPPAEAHGLILLTSRLAIADLSKWKAGATPVIEVEKLPDEAGAALLRDNSVWGTDKELKAASHDFGGHPLALGLLASFLKETQKGDIRRRDHVRAFLAGSDNPGHDHARRVMDSYEKEWLAGQPVLLAILHMVGLFDRPATEDCLQALRAAPAIPGLTDGIEALDDHAWHRAVARLREVRLLSPRDPSAPDALDAHPLVREWFGDRLRLTNEAAWRAAHGRLYEHLRDTTKEGPTPTLDALTPLFQAIPHGCRAGRHQEALDDIYKERICRRGPEGSLEFYSTHMLGAIGSELAALSWFFASPYATPMATLAAADQRWVLAEAALDLRSQGRFGEALPAMRAASRSAEEAADSNNAAIAASNLSQTKLLLGEVAAAVATAERAVALADRSSAAAQMIINQTTYADALQAAGQVQEATDLFAEAERLQCKMQPAYPLLYSLQGYRYSELSLAKKSYANARDRATQTLEWVKVEKRLIDIALDILMLGRAAFGLALTAATAANSQGSLRNDTIAAKAALDEAADALRLSGKFEHLPRAYLARAAFRRSVGDWDGAARDLDEVEEIAEPGPMKLHLCDMALERARLALARAEAFAPLNGHLDDGPPQPVLPDAAGAATLRDEARKNLATARGLIKTCGYHKRDEELAELESVLAGSRRFADLPPRV